MSMTLADVPANHPYRSLRLPNDAPFELKPSPGKGWGVFATELIKNESLILTERPLFFFEKPKALITVGEAAKAILSLPLDKKTQVSLMLKNGTSLYQDLRYLVGENSFSLRDSHSHAPAWGFFLLQSRFNNSCTPNSRIVAMGQGVIVRYANRDIQPGEEITSIHTVYDFVSTRFERQRRISFPCHCATCQLPPLLQQASDLRRRLMRGLVFLIDGEDQCSSSPVIIDTEMRRRAASFDLSLCTIIFFDFLLLFLLAEEGLFQDAFLAKFRGGLAQRGQFIRSESTRIIFEMAKKQHHWVNMLQVASRLYGRVDPGDAHYTFVRRQEQASRRMEGVVTS
ncbi:hypothetical protein N7466_004439 [Penicillium verhagenii]|uniref:uncharacterized protein n=1 Tax=Penicillium verhagenii TaxID=1562060 RepID=UPI00254565C5|nr:uncharacterized protein N7466_004439 [Penicillium verhagenii]KAJ5934892.1 hypothetical protein N7466_004439 [Penicillium verhagenii]